MICIRGFTYPPVPRLDRPHPRPCERRMGKTPIARLETPAHAHALRPHQSPSRRPSPARSRRLPPAAASSILTTPQPPAPRCGARTHQPTWQGKGLPPGHPPAWRSVWRPWGGLGKVPRRGNPAGELVSGASWRMGEGERWRSPPVCA